MTRRGTSTREKSKDAFHRKRLADDAAGEGREARPVGAELEFQWDTGSDPDREVDAQHPQPEARRRGRLGVVFPHRADLEEQREEREPHGELREEIVEGDGEAELQTMPEQWIGHGSPRKRGPAYRVREISASLRRFTATTPREAAGTRALPTGRVVGRRWPRPVPPPRPPPPRRARSRHGTPD